MMEWEQIKKEYREIPIPADGPRQMLQAIAKAKKKRNRFKNLAKYSTVAAAVLLVLLLPGMLLFSGGFGAKKENASMKADCVAESGLNSGSGSKNNASHAGATPSTSYDMSVQEGILNAESSAVGETVPEDELPKYSYSEDTMQDEDRKDIALESVATDLSAVTEEQKEAISREVLRQMEERIRNAGETYYIKGEQYPDGFEQIGEEQKYYINEARLLVVVFTAGAVAPEKQGTMEFIIPAEVYSPLE